MRGMMEVILRCDAKTFVCEWKITERLLLRGEAGQKRPLALLFFRGQRITDFLRLIPAREKRSCLHAVGPGVIKRPFKNQWRRCRRHGGDCPVHGKRAGIMVGMAPLIRMGEDHFRRVLNKNFFQRSNDRIQIQTGFLVGNGKCDGWNSIEPRQAQCVGEFMAARGAIVIERGKAMLTAVHFISRRTIRNMHQDRRAAPVQPRSQRDGFIVWMSEDQGGARRGKLRADWKSCALESFLQYGFSHLEITLGERIYLFEMRAEFRGCNVDISIRTKSQYRMNCALKALA